MRKGFSVTRAGEEERRVGRYIEGVFCQVVKFFIHARQSSRWMSFM